MKQSLKSTPAAFLSYSHVDDEHSRGALTKFRKYLSAEVCAHSGAEFTIFQDRDIEWGQNWRQRIDEALNSSTFLIPVITPSFFNSKECRREVQTFLKVEERLDRNDLILPLYFIDTPFISDCEANARDVLATAIAAHQYGDWRNLRLKTFDSPVVRRALEKLAIQLVTSLARNPRILELGSRKRTRKSVAPIHSDDINVAHLPQTGSSLFGRENELRMLDQAWADSRTNIVSFVAWGGVGKSALVNHWLHRMRSKNYRGAEKVFGVSFYSQGTRDQASSADLFMISALKWFGDPNPHHGDPEEKGGRLAKEIRKYKTLLILDGLEPLQFPLGERIGRLKNPGIRLMLKELASHNPGLVVLSSRLPIKDLTPFMGTSVLQADLLKLSPAAGRRLLKSEGANGPAFEMEKASEEFDGHALALSIMGHFLKMVFNGDIRRRDRIGPLNHHPDRGGHARRVIESYARWFRDEPERQVEYESLRMMGLFDRPIEFGAWKALIEKPEICDLTTNISCADESRWRYALGALREVRLLAEEKDENSPDAIDCHPLIREHFSEELRKNHPTAWQQAHTRLFEFFSPKTTQAPKTVEAMAPYYQAITHACFAGRFVDAFNGIYMPYIRQKGAYNTDTLRAFDDDYFALSRFLRKRRFELVSQLRDEASFILGEIGFDLRALGRLDDSLEAMEAALKADEENRDSVNAPAQAAILSHTYLIRGQIRKAITSADRGTKLAAGKRYFRMVNIGNRADGRHHAGELDLALKDFAEAERLSLALFGSPLRSLLGCRYCDCLLSLGKYAEVLRRTKETMKWDKKGGYKLDDLPVRERHQPRHALQLQGAVVPLALNRLARCRAFLQKIERTAGPSDFRSARAELEKALEGLRKAETRHELPRGLLVEVHLLRLEKNFDEAHRKLSEVLAIVRDGKMELYEADAHLQLAWLALGESKRADTNKSLEKVRSLITKLGYYCLAPQADEIERRLGEL